MRLAEPGLITNTKPQSATPTEEKPLIAVPTTDTSGKTTIKIENTDTAISYDDAKNTYTSRYGATAADNANIEELSQTTGKQIGVKVDRKDLEELNDINKLSNGYLIEKVNDLPNNNIGYRYRKGDIVNENTLSNNDKDLTDLDRLKLGVLVGPQKTNEKEVVNAALAEQATPENRVNLAGKSQTQDAYLVDNPYTGGKSIVDSTGRIYTGYTHVEDNYKGVEFEAFELPPGTMVGGKDITIKESRIENSPLVKVDKTNSSKSFGELTLPSDNQNGLQWGDKNVWVDPISLDTYKTVETVQEGLQYNTKQLDFYNSIGIGGYGPLGKLSPLSRFVASEVLGFANMLPGTALTIEATLQNPAGFDKELTKGRNTLPLYPVYNNNNELLLRGSNNVVQGSNVANSGLAGLLTIGSIKITPDLTPSNAIESIGTEAGYSRTPYIDSIVDIPNRVSKKIGDSLGDPDEYFQKVEWAEFNELKRISDSNEFAADHPGFTGLQGREHTQYLFDRSKPGFVEQRNSEGLVEAWRTDTTMGGNFKIARNLKAVDDESFIINAKPLENTFKIDDTIKTNINKPVTKTQDKPIKKGLFFVDDSGLIQVSRAKTKSSYRNVEPESMFTDDVFGKSKSQKSGLYDDITSDYSIIKNRKIGVSDTDASLGLLSTGKSVLINSEFNIQGLKNKTSSKTVISNDKVSPYPPIQDQFNMNIGAVTQKSSTTLQQKQTAPTVNEMVYGKLNTNTNNRSVAKIYGLGLPNLNLGGIGGGGSNKKRKTIKNTRNPVGDLTKMIGITPTNKKIKSNKKNAFRGLL